MRASTYSFDFGWEDEEFGPLIVHYEYEEGEPQTWHHPGCAPTAAAYLCQPDTGEKPVLLGQYLPAPALPASRHNQLQRVYEGDFCPVRDFQEECDAAAYEDACKREESCNDEPDEYDYDRRDFTEPWY